MFPDDWIAGTAGLTGNQTLAYFGLLLAMYSRGEPIPAELANDTSTLARRCKLQPYRFREALQTLIGLGKITRLDDGRLSNPRFEKEIHYQKELSARARARSRTRWHQKDKEINGAPMHNHNHKGRTLPTAESSSSCAHDARATGSLAPLVNSLPRPPPDASDMEVFEYLKALNGRGKH